MSGGVFSHLHQSIRPKRIKVKDLDMLSNEVSKRWGHLFDNMYCITSPAKMRGDSDTGDLDVVAVPKNRDTLLADVQLKDTVYASDIVAFKRNGPQIMLAVKNLLEDGNVYMIDFLLTTTKSFEYKVFYHNHGTIVPALVGSFARQLSYKFDMQALYARVKNKSNNFKNVELTTNMDDVFKILMLSPKKLGDADLYTAEGVVKWISESPRFDSAKWKTPPEDRMSGRVIVVENRKSHAAAKKRPEVNIAYDLMRKCDNVASVENVNYEIERRVLGDDIVDELRSIENEKIVKNDTILSGHDVKELMGIPNGPLIGKILADVNSNSDLTDIDSLEARRVAAIVYMRMKYGYEPRS